MSDLNGNCSGTNCLNYIKALNIKSTNTKKAVKKPTPVSETNNYHWFKQTAGSRKTIYRRKRSNTKRSRRV